MKKYQLKKKVQFGFSQALDKEKLWVSHEVLNPRSSDFLLWSSVTGWKWRTVPKRCWWPIASQLTIGQQSAENWLVKQGWDSYYGRVIMFLNLRQWSTSLLCLWSVSKTPSTLKSDSHLISPYNIAPESNIQLRRTEEMITNSRTSWSSAKFSS